MQIRALYPRDLEQVKAIHEKFYEKEFDFGEFSRKYLSSFAVLEDDQVICAGGVRSVAEVVMVTDRSCSVRMRKNALLMAMDASRDITINSGHDSMYAFIHDEGWLKQLLSVGFMQAKGKPVFIPVKTNG